MSVKVGNPAREPMASGVSRALGLKFYLTSQLLIEIDIKSYQHSPEHGNTSIPEDYVATMRKKLISRK